MKKRLRYVTHFEDLPSSSTAVKLVRRKPRQDEQHRDLSSVLLLSTTHILRLLPIVQYVQIISARFPHCNGGGIRPRRSHINEISSSHGVFR